MRFCAIVCRIAALAVLASMTVASSCSTPDVPKEPEQKPVTLKPQPGQAGYALEGPYHFTGTLQINAQQGGWDLAGTFQFPTTGYGIGATDIVMLKSIPEHVTVTIRVIPPAKGASVTEAVTPVPVGTHIAVSARATFAVYVQEVRR